MFKSFFRVFTEVVVILTLMINLNILRFEQIRSFFVNDSSKITFLSEKASDSHLGFLNSLSAKNSSAESGRFAQKFKKIFRKHDDSES